MAKAKKSKVFCPCCKQTIRDKNPHSLGAGHVKVLETIAKSGATWTHAQQGDKVFVEGEKGRAPYKVNSMACVLTWFGLLERRERMSGDYRVTAEGIAFLKGRHTVPPVIWSFDGEVVGYDPGAVSIHSVKHVVYDAEYWKDYYQITVAELPAHTIKK